MITLGSGVAAIVTGENLAADLGNDAAEVGAGLSIRIIEQLSGYVEVDYRILFDASEGTRALQGTGGFRLAF